MEIRIEQIAAAIRVYQDFWRMYSIQHAVAAVYRKQLYTPCGPHFHFKDLGQFLLGLPHTLANEGLEKFAPPPDFPNANEHGYNLYLPFVLVPWVTSGRHTYGLTDELQAVLSGASIGNMRWCDFLPPFESFSIQLAQPISVPGGGSFNHILMTCQQSGGKTRFAVWTFSACLKNYRGIDQEMQKNLNRWFANRNFDKLRGRVNRLSEHLRDCVKGGLRTLHVVSSDELIGSWLEELGDPTSRANKHKFMDSDQLPAIKIACRIALGIGLYLQSGSRQSERRPRRRHSLTTRTVELEPFLDTTEERIPVLRLRKPLSLREREYFGICRNSPNRDAVLRQIYCHWVRAHKRHHPGESPDTEKRVKVGAYMVLADKLPEFGLLPGTYAAVG